MRTFALAVFLALPAAAVAQRDAAVPDPDPELERKSFQVADGFEVNLYAADPLLAKPIQMNFDPQGRLWLACSEVYPQIKPGQTANDKILVLEDADGDGKAEKTTVFADGLLIPTAVAPGDGGAYAADSTDLVHFSDPDPATGKARKKRIVLSGFGTEDTHHILHTLRWGPDALLYFSQSIYIHSHVETPHGVRRLNAGGIWRFRPETTQLDVFARGWVNTWGTAWDKSGATFATDGAYGEGINYVVPGAYYYTAEGSKRILGGLNSGSPKHCGLEVVGGRHLPPDWQGNMITNDFRGHRVNRFDVVPDGSGFASREKPDLIRTSHPAFRPIDVKMGPDGAIYVADWYNPIIQHGEVDFRDPRRDKTHGRIWRVSAKGRPLVERPKLVGATTAELLDQLKAPEQWTRTQAKRVLKERGKDAVLPELAAWVAKLDPAADAARLEALWVTQAFDTLNLDLLNAVLNGNDSTARAAACRVAGTWVGRLPDPVGLLAKRVADDAPRVRLEAVRALAEVGTAAAAVEAAKALDKPVDRWLDYAVWLTLRDLAPAWLPELQAGRLDFGGNPQHITFALQAAGTGDVAKPLLALLRSGKLAKDREAEVWVRLAQVGGPAELGAVVAEAVKLEAAEARGRLLTAVEEAARARKVAPSPNAAEVARFAADDHPASRRAAMRLVGQWKLAAGREALERFAAAAKGDPADRSAALDGLVAFGDAASRSFLTGLTATDKVPDVRRHAVAALAELDPAAAATAAADVLTQDGLDAAPLFTAFVQRKGGAGELAKALAGKTVPADTAKVGIRVAKAAGQPEASLVAALTTAGGLTAPKREWSKAEIDALAADAVKNGDAARGEQVYRRAEMSCLKCHAIAGAGGAVGPEVTSLGGSAQPDYIVESLLLPNAKIKEGYHSQVVTTTAGKVVTGIKVRESATELLLRDADDREILIPAGDVDEKKDGKSLMPDGLTDALTRQEFLDLTKFLSALGKVGGGYAATPGRVVRRWETVQLTKELHTLANRDRIGVVAKPGAKITWVPAYTLVSGDLPLDALPPFKPHSDQPAYGVARFQLDVSTAGPVKLALNSPAGVMAWVDGLAADVAKDMVLDLPAGVRTVTLVVRPDQRKEPLRVELDEVAGSPARARIVGGK